MFQLNCSFFLAFLAFAFSADHEIFKDCARNDLCSKLRNSTGQEKLLTLLNVGFTNLGDLQVALTDGTALNLQINIWAIENDIFRLKIREINSTRYELEHVLDNPRVLSNFDDFVYGDDHVELAIGDHRVKINYSPLKIEFLKNGVGHLVIGGDRLIIDDENFAFEADFAQAVQLYGIHEHADALALRNTGPGVRDPYRLRNLDVSGYELDSPMALYGSIPVLYGHGSESTSGFFLHNAAEQWYEIQGSKTFVMVKTGTLDLFVLPGPTPTQVVRQYTSLTGRAQMPQLWTLGYHQCRWNYDNQSDVKNVVAKFNQNNFPLDVIWLDIEYTDGKKYFTWNPENFSDPEEMQRNISATHKRLVTIIDPHIKIDEDYEVYSGAKEENLFVKTSDGADFEGVCWPGNSSYIDFLNPAARDFYSSFYSYEKFSHTTPVLSGIWNDMNEPSVFNDSSEKTMPDDAVHFGNVQHKDIHNIYGLLHTMATHQGLINRDNGTNRPFILSRSHFSGTQRYSAIWTGDNTAIWGYLSVSYSECLNANILGIVFCGADIGGFDGNPDLELLQRWYQAGAWLPFYRSHANMDTERREPYLFDASVQEVIRNALFTRYQHLPEWYTLFHEHELTGDPVIRPLFYHYPADANVFKIDDQLLLGRDILIRAVALPGTTSVQVYFPGDELWLRIDNGKSSEIYSGGYAEVAVTLESIPYFYRTGSIIVTKQTPRLSTDEMKNDGHTLIVNLGEENEANGTIYLDDYTSFAYRDNLEYSYLGIEFDGKNVKIRSIDERANFKKFAFIVDEVRLNQVVEVPRNGRKGRYSQRRFKVDAEGRRFRELKLDNSNELVFRLPTL